jgi:hypothetical protein
MKHKQDIIKQIETRIKTTMIGSLARFEEAFGELLEQSDQYSDLWYDVRTKILNNGNHQIRLATEELEAFIYGESRTKIHFEDRYKYNYKFYPKQDRSNDEN